jgi:hypothetical protein
MTKEDIIILGAIAGGIAAVVSAVLNGMFTILNQWLIGRREERRHMLDLCFKAATENLQKDTELRRPGLNRPAKELELARLISTSST